MSARELCRQAPRASSLSVGLPRIAPATIARAAIALLALATVACGPSPDPQTLGLDAIFFQWHWDNSPGCVAAASRDGEILFERAWGMANLELGVSLKPDSVMNVGSVSKQFTAAAVALMVLRGELDLDADIRPWFPELRVEQAITVRHLLHHTSGIRDYLELMWLAGHSNRGYVNNDIGLEFVSRQRMLNFEPGEQHLYSNSGYLLLAELIDRVSGSPLRAAASENLFLPLGMKHTVFADDYRDVVPRRASSYGRRPDGTYLRYLNNSDSIGAGGALSTVGDLLRWAANFAQPRVGGDALIELLLTRGVLSDGQELDYAMGLEHGEHRGAPTLGHGGSLEGFRAALTMFPEQGFAVAVLCNVANSTPEGYANQIADLFLADELGAGTEASDPSGGSAGPSPATSLSLETLDMYVGRYDAGDDVLTVSRNATGLVIAAPGGRASPMESLSEVRFRVLAVDLVLRFDHDEAGRVTGMTMDPEGDAKTALRLAPFEPAADWLSEYEGDYVCDELDVVYRVAALDGRPRIVVNGRDRGSLDPLGADLMLSPFGRLEFERDDDDSITGFRLDSGRVKRLAFRRSSSTR